VTDKLVNIVNEKVLLARGRELIEIPQQQWEKHLASVPEHSKSRLSFMSADHHRVRYFVVRELPAHGRPIAPAFIAQELQLPLVRVQTILDELEQNLFFLFRNERGAVAWAYPVTVDETPHRLTFDSGEQLYAA
jgi:hypothetical protein